MSTARATIVTGTVAALLVLGGGVAAAGGGGGGPCGGFAQGGTLSIRDFCFDGTAHFTDVGTELVVKNEGDMAHTFTAADGSFDSGDLAPGETFSMSFDEPGIYRVYCRPHGSAEGGGMTGVVIVGEPTPEGAGAAEIVGDLRNMIRSELGSIQGVVAEEFDKMSAMRGKMSLVSNDVREVKSALVGDREAADATVLGATSTPEGNDAAMALLVGLALGVAGSALVVGRRILSQATGPSSED